MHTKTHFKAYKKEVPGEFQATSSSGSSLVTAQKNGNGRYFAFWQKERPLCSEIPTQLSFPAFKMKHAYPCKTLPQHFFIYSSKSLAFLALHNLPLWCIWLQPIELKKFRNFPWMWISIWNPFILQCHRTHNKLSKHVLRKSYTQRQRFTSTASAVMSQSDPLQGDSTAGQP